jgi:hypothetical protein
MFFTYAQNNSGGVFTGPALYVIVEAHSAGGADLVAQSRAGVYFDGCENGNDCSCCGDRWYATHGDGDPEPRIYGKPIATARHDGLRSDGYIERAGAYAVIHYADGRTEVVK